jgi:subtilisin family serine protease
VYTTNFEQRDADWGLDRVSAPYDGKYKYKYSGAGVKVFVLDGGIRMTHNDFSGRVSCGFSVVNDNCEDANGHATHVAGIIGGVYSGVAKDVNLISVKIFEDDGYATDAYLFAALDYVVDEKIKSPRTPMVINISLGNRDAATIYNSAIAKVIAKNITVVASAGNDAVDACTSSPGSASTAITVGSTNITNLIAVFSNIGRCVDIFAPGFDIKSADFSNDDLFIQYSGTSMSAPFVAGVAALHLEKTPTLSPKQVWAAIKSDAYVGRIRRFKYGDGTPNRFIGVRSLLK